MSKLFGDLVGSVSGNVADAIAKVVAKATHAVSEVVGNVVDALLGKGGMSKPVKQLLTQIGHVLADLRQAIGELLFGDGNTGPIDLAMKQIGGAVASLTRDLAHTLGGTLSIVLSGVSDVPAPASSPVVQSLASHWDFWRVDGTTGRVDAAAGNIVETMGERLDGVRSRAIQEPSPAHRPFVPPSPLIPVVPPGVPAPASYSFLSASGSSADAVGQLLCVLAQDDQEHTQGGRLSWHQRQPHKPHSALRLAAERPG